jgi:hypothetical protein
MWGKNTFSRANESEIPSFNEANSPIEAREPSLRLEFWLKKTGFHLKAPVAEGRVKNFAAKAM